MRIEETRILVTGGSGFIGSAVVRRLAPRCSVLNLDALTYAATPDALAEVQDLPNYRLVHGDVRDRALVDGLFQEFRPNSVIHLAAESHVDRSLDGPGAFLSTNINGTFVMLEAALQYWRGLPRRQRDAFRFLHVSTDEVFGEVGDGERFTETSPYKPNNPYSASKAAADHLVRAWRASFGLPTLISNCSNNFGPWQFPEKFIPVVISNCLAERQIPVYGDGGQIRDWLFVEDHAAALETVLTSGEAGETYVVGGDGEHSNLDVALKICTALDALKPRENGLSYKELIAFVPDRPGHDRRYAINADKIKSRLGWRPQSSFADSLNRTVQWYIAHQGWWENLIAADRVGGRLGLNRTT